MFRRRRGDLSRHPRGLWRFNRRVVASAVSDDVNLQPENYGGNADPYGLRSCYNELRRYDESLVRAHRDELGREDDLDRFIIHYVEPHHSFILCDQPHKFIEDYSHTWTTVAILKRYGTDTSAISDSPSILSNSC